MSAVCDTVVVAHDDDCVLGHGIRMFDVAAFPVHEGLPVHVVPLRTPEREAKLVATQRDALMHHRRGTAALGF